MKALFILVVCAIVVAAVGQEAKTNAPGQTSETHTAGEITMAFPASASKLSAPFVLTNGYISQLELTDLAGGGKAIFNFTIAKSGDYVVSAVVNAPDDSSNSIFVNVDGQPEDPLMIWDIEVTSGFEERPVSWRGNGSDGNAEFAPKHFILSAGAHRLIVVGREPVQVKSVSIRAAGS